MNLCPLKLFRLKKGNFSISHELMISEQKLTSMTLYKDNVLQLSIVNLNFKDPRQK